MQSMQYLQIHNFASIIDSFMFDVALDAIVENELKIVSFSIMSYDRMIFMPLMDKPMTEVTEKGRGAADAAYDTALDLEKAKLEGKAFVGGGTASRGGVSDGHQLTVVAYKGR